MNDPKQVSVIDAEEIIRRINEAKRLRGEGASIEEIAAVEPTQEEMRAVLMNLRKDRSSLGGGKATKAKQPKTLDGLLGEPL